MSPHGHEPFIKAQRKEILKAARASKKAKFMDDLIIAEAARIRALRDQWLLNNNKMNPNLKARLEKAKVAEQRHQAQLDKARKKAQEKAQINDIRKLAIGNRQICAFKDILSDLVSIPSSDPPKSRSSSTCSNSRKHSIRQQNECSKATTKGKKIVCSQPPSQQYEMAKNLGQR